MDREGLRSNIATALADLWQQYETWLRGAGGPDETKQDRDRFRELFDSVKWRLDAIEFHISLTHDWHELHEEAIAFSDLPDPNRSFLKRGVQQTSFLFDDIVFNAVSLFDYLACLAVQVHLDWERSQLEWPKLISRLRNELPNDQPASVIPVAERWNRRLVAKLVRYRGEVIHLRSDSPGGAIERDLLEGTSKLRVDQPERFRQRAVLGSAYAGASLPEAAEHLGAQTLSSTSDLASALVSDVRDRPYRKGPPSASAQVSRWVRKGLLSQLNRHPLIRDRDYRVVGNGFSSDSFSPILKLEAGGLIHGPAIQLGTLTDMPTDSPPVDPIADRIRSFMDDRESD